MNGNGPLDLPTFMELVGPHRLDSDPERSDALQLGRVLDDYARNLPRLGTNVQQSLARRCVANELTGRGVGRPWELLTAAVQDAQQNAFAVSTKGLDETKRIWALDDLLQEPAQPPEWVLHGYAARGELTLLAGAAKTGKTTFMAQLVNRVAVGAPFVGRDVTRTSTLWLNLEMRHGRTVELFRDLGSADLPIHLADHVPADPVQTLRDLDAGLLVVDTLSRLWDGSWPCVPRVDVEDDNVQVTDALAVIRAIADAANCAIILIDHTRKGGGEHGEDIRGASSKVAQVDVAVSFKRDGHGDTRRILDTVSRDSTTPRKLVVDFGPDGLYTALGTVGEVRDREQRTALLTAAATDRLTVDELAEVADLPKSATRRLAAALHDEGRLQRDGTGKKGCPFRYSRNEG